jgi:hypothetical protein
MKNGVFDIKLANLPIGEESDKDYNMDNGGFNH